MTGSMRQTRSTSTTMASAPPVHPRSDENDAQPTPKKLKSEHRTRSQRRPALRDVTNERLRQTAQVGDQTSKLSTKLPTKWSAVKDESTVDDGSAEDDEQAMSAHSGDLAQEMQERTSDVAAMEEQETWKDSASVTASSSSPRESLEHIPFLDIELPLEADEELASIQHRRLRAKQAQNRVLVDYLEDQPQVNAKMRIILVDWLVEIHHRFKLEPETLFLAINYLDRYLAESMVTRGELQLVGLASLFIAAKFEEVEALEIADLVYVCDETYTMDQIIDMERTILTVLGFNLATASTHAFLTHFTNELHADQVVRQLAAFFAQTTLLQLSVLLRYAPSELAASSLFLAQCVAANERPDKEWITRWQSAVDYDQNELLPCLEDLSTVMANPSKKVAALRNKFGTKRYGRVAHKPVDKLDAFLSPSS